MRRRWWTWATAVLLALAALGAGFYYLFLPNWRPALQMGESYGIDVSHHQGSIDWAAVANDDIGFAYIKATEGVGHVDSRFAENWAGAGQAGLERGAYHFFTLCSSGADQARQFLAAAPPDPKALPPAVDLELIGACGLRPPAAHVNQQLDEFLRIVEEAWGRPALLYVGDDFEQPYPTRERLRRPLWHRRFLRRPNVDGWVVWQLHGEAHVKGVDGRVDLNVKRPVTDK